MATHLHTLQNHVQSTAEAVPRLPLMHTTNSWHFRTILATATLQPTWCDVFKEDLLYLFYGRPEYKPSHERPPTSHLGGASICFILSPDCLSSIKRIYPFDSGAFARQLYKAQLLDGMTLEDFSLPAVADIPPRVVRSFFGSNENYYFGNAVESKSIDPLEYEVQCYYNLIREQGTADYDDRRSSIEISTTASITLSDTSVKAVVLPKNLLDSTSVNTTLRSWKAKIYPYPVHRCRPIEFMAFIFAAVQAHLGENGFL
jgi:hypothetical protein